MPRNHEDSETRKQFAQKMKSLRKSFGYSQTTLAAEITRRQDPSRPAVRPQTISSWERGHIPSTYTLTILCEIFDVTQDYLTAGDTGTTSLKNFAMYKYATEIDDKQIPQFEKWPLFYVPKARDRNTGYWGIVDMRTNSLITCSGSIPLKDLDGKLYTQIPSYDYDPIPLEEAKAMNTIYIVPVGVDFPLRNALRGYYSYSEDLKCFIRNDHTFGFPEGAYGVSYIGYREIPKYIL